MTTECVTTRMNNSLATQQRHTGSAQHTHTHTYTHTSSTHSGTHTCTHKQMP